MKQKAIIVLSLLALAVSAFALAPLGGKLSQKESLIRDTGTWIDVNQILMFVTNKGSFAYDQGGLLGKNDGLYFPFTSLEDIADQSNNTSVIFAAGIWVGAVDVATGDTLVTIAEYADDWYPGPMIGNTFDPGSDTDPADRVYKLHADSLASNPNQDYTEWPVADGAPVDSNGNPAMLGDQMLWSVFNDANPAPHTNDASSAIGMGLEIRQTTFAFDRTDALANIVFVKYQIYNKGTLTLADMFVSLWADPDLGNAGDDLVGSDTVLSLGYCYNEGNDSDYGSDPPAVGFDFFQGPLIFTGDNADTARMWDTTFVGYLNMGMTSFNKYINGTDPQNLTWTYQYMNGLDASLNGAPLANGTKFYGPGDPTTGVGDLDFASSDRRYMLTTGPFNFAPGDSTEILAAVIVGQGGDRLSSISVLKFNDKFAQQAYDNNFQLLQPPAAPAVEVHQLDGRVVLEWIKTSEVSPGDYPFQGYSVFQGISAAATDPWTRIANFDIVDGVAIIIDEVLDPLTGVIEQRAIKFGSDNGVTRFIGISNDIINAGPLNNSTEYFFKVEAYSYNSDPVATPKTLTSATIVSATPQRPVAGIELGNVFNDTLAVTHVSGISDGTVIPFIVDPEALTGDSYMVTFFDTVLVTVVDTGMGPESTFTNAVYWNLENVTQSTMLVVKQFNQTGDNDYEIVDGFLLKVTGPPVPGMRDWDIPNGTRRFTWANADGFGWEGFNGAIGWGGPGDVFGSYTPMPPSSHVSVLLILAQVDTLDGSDTLGSFAFDPNDVNVSYAYRYGRAFTSPPAQPGFVPFMIDVTLGGYRYQDFAQSVPLSAWNVDVNPPQRLAVGYLENNQVDGRVDGKWFPGSFGNYDNTAGSGPREWLWIFLEDYSTTPNAAYQGDAIGDSMPILWWLTVNRRGVVPFSPGGTGEDEFLILSNHINTPTDVFTFSAPAPSVSTSGEDFLADINVAPNPYYLFGGYDASKINRVLKFRNLPEKCTISIYNLAGDFITSLEKDDLTSEIAWNIANDFNVPVASGIYIYVVDAPGFGQKIGKMAIFTEIEILGQY